MKELSPLPFPRPLLSSPFPQVVAFHLTPAQIAGLRELFEAIDADHSGTISLEELTAALVTTDARVAAAADAAAQQHGAGAAAGGADGEVFGGGDEVFDALARLEQSEPGAAVASLRPLFDAADVSCTRELNYHEVRARARERAKESTAVSRARARF